MVKNNILTPVLAGVLGVSIVGSGIGYYVVNKNADDSADSVKNGGKQSAKLEQAAASFDETLQTAEKAMKGELDFAFDGQLVFTPGAGLIDEAGYDLSPVKLTASAKQKGENTGMEYGSYYGDKKLATLNVIYTRSDDTAYFQVPELTDAYLKVSKEKAEEYVSDNTGYGDYTELMESLRENSEGLDYTFWADELKNYEQVIKDSFPEVQETGELTGDISGVGYTYTTKTYTVTTTDATNVMIAVLEKAKSDTTLKSYYDKAMEQQKERYASYGYEDYEIPSYEEMIDEEINDMKESIAEETDGASAKLITYLDSDEHFVGFDLIPQNEDAQGQEIKFVLIDTPEAFGVDYSMVLDDVNMTVYGAIKDTDGASNGEIKTTVTYTDEYDYYGEEETTVETTKFELVFSVKDLKADDDSFTGSMRVDFNYGTDDPEDSVSGWFEISSNSGKDNLDLAFDLGVNGKNFCNLKITGSKTEASDITLPGQDAKFYDPTDEDQLEQYLADADSDGFVANIKAALGDDLYDELFGSRQVDYYDDYSYDDWDDDDWDDYDWEDTQAVSGGLSA